MAWQGMVSSGRCDAQLTGGRIAGLFNQTQLANSDKIANAAIIGQAGGIWAKSPDYEVRFRHTLFISIHRTIGSHRVSYHLL
jgi:hypothetical protein